MPRVPNTRPTVIYWLIDVRPETLVVWSNGLPFYCGKTVIKPALRYSKHRSDARKHPERTIAKRIHECGDHIRMQTMEVVTFGSDWGEREKFWIHTIRLLYPNTVNKTSGGQGMPGYIPSPETRAKRSTSLKGRVFTAEHRARIGLASANRSPDVCVRIGASQKGKTISAEHRLKLSSAGLGKKRSAETRARMKAAAANRTPERYAKIGAKLKGRVFSAETIARMRAGQLRRYGKSNA